MAATCGQFAFVDTHSHLSPGCFQITMDYFNQMLAQVVTWVLSHTHDGDLNNSHLWVCTCGHSNLVIYHPISSKFYEKLLSNFRPSLNRNCVC